MGREVRRVPGDWEHPKDASGNYMPLYGGSYSNACAEFLKKANADGWEAAEDWLGAPPSRDDYMPEWTEAERTHWQMYEDTSEGTPISPPMETPEALAQWLADHNASAFGDMTATREQWLATIRAGWAPSMIIVDGQMISGVEATAERTEVTRDE